MQDDYLHSGAEPDAQPGPDCDTDANARTHADSCSDRNANSSADRSPDSNADPRAYANARSDSNSPQVILRGRGMRCE